MKNNKTTLIAEPGKQETVFIREFEAPRELVFKAYTDEGLYAQWLGPRGLVTTFEYFVPKSGGKWRFVQQDNYGNKYAFNGVYHEILAPERISSTFEFEGLPEKGHVMLDTIIFEELPGGRTKVVTRSIYQSVADRDGMIESGMEQGVVEGYERLDELLENMKPASAA